MRVWVTLLVIALASTAPGSSRAESTKDTPTPTPAPASEGEGEGTAKEPPTISPQSAADHVGEEVVVEGRVHAVHVSPLATVLAFAPNFAGFTATIHAADRARFPENVHETARNHAVRLRGRIRTYRGRAEMTLSNPSQLVVLDTAEAPRAGAPAVSSALAEDLRATLARIQARLDGVEHRLATLEQEASASAAGARTEGLAVGMPASAAEATLGPPLEEFDDPTGLRVWVYGNGRTLTFDASARVIAWSGF